MVQYKWVVLSNTTLGALMASINGTITLISLPVIFRGLNIDPFAASNFTLLIWVLLGYGVVTATMLVTLGRLSDMYGRARLYNLGFAIFSFGSILLFLTPNTGVTGGWEIVGFRLVQAAGAAFLFANSAALITDAFKSNERGLALGINQVAAIGGSVIGLILGGLLAGLPTFHILGIDVPAWRMIFLVSVPVGVFGTVWAYLQLHEIATIRKGQKLDLPGNITFGAGLTVLLIGITYGLMPYGNQPMGWADPWVVAGIVGGLALLVIFLFVETQVADPMFHLGLFRIRAFAAANVAAFLASIARGGMMFMMVMWFQGIWLPLHGYSYEQTPFWAGIYMLPMMGGFLAMGPLSGWLSDRYGAKHLASGGLALGSATFFAMLLLPYDFAYWQMGALLFVQGCGMGLFASPNRAAIMNAVPAEHRGVASGMATTLQNSGMQFSMAMFFTILIVGISTGLPSSIGGALATANVPAVDQPILGHVLSNDPTGAIFGAFLGVNPMATLLAAMPLPVPIQNGSTVYNNLTSKEFFPNAIAPAFLQGVREALFIAGVLTLAAALFSLMRGERYVHGESSGSMDSRSSKDSPAEDSVDLDPAGFPERARPRRGEK
ncbi:MAG: MFS transporter [Nitrososphaerota archaeon]|jgi:MFS family permease|nr:MFS transporter [Nitrososphaerota archaeon]